MNQYKKLKEKHQKEFNKFPMFFAFTNDDLVKGLKKLGFNGNASDLNKIISIGHGGFIRKSDKQKYINMMERHHKELWDNISNDKSGDGFILDMFSYELENHEYIVTYDELDTLNALNITEEDLKNNSNLLNGLNLAKSKIVKNYEDSGYEY